jgi:DNA polymerase-3 subunit beta
VATDGSRVTVTCGDVRFVVPTMSAEDYPPLPSFPPPVGEVDTLGFAAAVGQVAPAAGRDDMVPVLTAVRLEFASTGLTLVATDRYRLAVRTISWQPTVHGPEAVAHVPAKLLADVAKTPTSASRVALGLGGTERRSERAEFPSEELGRGRREFATERSGDTADEPGGLRLGLSAGGRQTIIRLLDGAFPTYRRLLPDSSPVIVTAQIAPLAAAVRRVALVATRTAPLRFTFLEGTITAEAGTEESARAFDTVPVEYDGPALTVFYNPSYLLDGLAAIDGDEATIGFADADPVVAAAKPAVLGGKENGDGFRYLLMPIRRGG